MTTGAAIIAAGLFTAALWLSIEGWAWLTGRPLITTQVRNWNRATGGLVGVLFGLVTGFLGGHFFWCVPW